MNTYVIVYRSIDDQTVTQTFTITAQNDRWALQLANQEITTVPGHHEHAWDLDSITIQTPPTPVEPVDSTTTSNNPAPTTGATTP